MTAYVGAGLGTLEQAANGAGVVLCASIFNDFIIPKLFSSKKYVICPFIDMANHASLGSNGDVSFEFFGNAYSLASTVDIAASSEVTISYGARSNDQWLQYYGFVEEDNPNDVYVLPPLREWNIAELEQKAGVQVLGAGRLEKLNRAGLLGDVGIESSSSDEDDKNTDANPNRGVVVTRSIGLDPAVVQALRALVSTDAEWEQAGQAIGNFADELSPENEARALLVAKTQLQLTLDSKATTLAQDMELKKKTASSSMEEEDLLALQFRIEKKKLLQETIDNL